MQNRYNLYLYFTKVSQMHVQHYFPNMTHVMTCPVDCVGSFAGKTWTACRIWQCASKKLYGCTVQFQPCPELLRSPWSWRVWSCYQTRQLSWWPTVYIITPSSGVRTIWNTDLKDFYLRTLKRWIHTRSAHSLQVPGW